MPFTRNNQRTFHRTLFAGMLETITLLKRGDDQQQGTVTAYQLFHCWHSQRYNTGNTLQRDMGAGDRCVWNIPRVELQRVGVAYLDPLDRIVSRDYPTQSQQTWQPESDTQIEVKLFDNYVNVACHLRNPTGPLVPA